jgi:hypothetical protein
VCSYNLKLSKNISVITHKTPEKNLQTSRGTKEGANADAVVLITSANSVNIIVLLLPHTSPTAPHKCALHMKPGDKQHCKRFSIVTANLYAIFQ